MAPTIRFCRGKDIRNRVGFSSRSITRINLNLTDGQIAGLNDEFSKFRRDTRDVFLTPFKGLRKDGMYRRRLDYGLARKFVSKYA